VAWYEQQDEKGLVKPGKFFQVEFMVRDSQKYAKTLGWGFGRWRGTDLKPYGKDANFATECVGCHKALGNTNYVFTMPIGGQK
jgi:Cytochrome P460